MTETSWLNVPNVRMTGIGNLLSMADFVRCLVYPDRARRQFGRESDRAAALELALTAARRAAARAGAPRPTERKLVLFMSASCRLAWRYVTDPACRQLVEDSESRADGLAPGEQTRAALRALRSARSAGRAARRAAKAVWSRPPLLMLDAAEAACGAVRRMYFDDRDAPGDGTDAPDADPWGVCEAVIRGVTAAGWCAARAAGHLPYPGGNVGTEQMGLGMHRLMREIFGNPFRPVAFDPMWRTSDAVLLARGVYESRDFSAMPILADALQDAGCDDEVVLRHCQQGGEHVRGCWVVDLVLGKA
jgi:hypothetical protein